MSKNQESYFGGKGGDGVYQRIINQIPPHDVWLVPFAGHCAVTRHKRPAETNILWELDPEVYKWWKETNPEYLVRNMDSMKHPDFSLFLSIMRWVTIGEKGTKIFTYMDPPYLHCTRSSQKRYPFDFTREQHTELLQLASKLPGMVAISSYPNRLYDQMLIETHGWRKIEFTAQTRGGGRTEALYMNYPEPTELHDYSYIGNDFREREAIKRRRETIIRKIDKMEGLEKSAMLQYIAAKMKNGDTR